jgi:dihydropteroate synthase
VRKACDIIGDFIVNDISAGEDDPLMLPTVGELGLTYAAMHKRGNPLTMSGMTDYEDVVHDVKTYFDDFSVKAESYGIKDWILDPGIGFSKTAGQCWELLRDLATVAPLPELAVGISRKSFLGWVSGEKEPAKRLGESLAIELELASAKTAIIRTHAVRELHNALSVATYFRRLKEK